MMGFKKGKRAKSIDVWAMVDMPSGESQWIKKKDKKYRNRSMFGKGKPEPPSTPGFFPVKRSFVEMTACVPARMMLKDDFGWEGT